MKKFLAALTLAAAAVVSACWFTESNFNATYIASVNGQAVHYNPASSLNAATYRNGQSVDLPLTVQVKVSDRFEDRSGESGSRPVVKAVLQYKVIRRNGTSTPFLTVKTLDHPDWKMNFANPVNLFGKDGIIDIAQNEIAAGDDIIIRVWFSDGIYATGDIDSDLAASDVPDTQNAGNIDCGVDGWKAPHVFRVKFSGKRRLII